MSFPTSYDEVIALLDKIDAVKYGYTRNFLDGAVTRLSPYISRGVISTKVVLDHVLQKGHELDKIEKFVQELAWRDYWQQVWIAKGDQINVDLKHPQAEVSNHQMPTAIIEAKTGIQAIDAAITRFYQDGYLHNHLRMYIASIACNVGKSHWKIPSQWMYYHLLDGDWASNTLSWQWVAGANANKKYYANQENINKYCYTKQYGTFLDTTYEALVDLPIPSVLQEVSTPDLKSSLPTSDSIKVDPSIPTLLYNYYNLDPRWRSEEHANRVLLLEPSVFKQYPVSEKAISFVLDLSKNISNIQVYVGEYDQLVKEIGGSQLIFKEHPLNKHYQGIEDSRDWMTNVTGYFPSFFTYWKKCKKQLA